MLSCLGFSFCALGLAASARAADATTFQVLSLSKLPSHDAVMVRGALSGTYVRPWNPALGPASYKVPVWTVYPLHGGDFNGAALVEPMHPSGGNDFLALLSRNTQEFNTLAVDPANGFAELDLVRGLDGADVLWRKRTLASLNGTYIYATAVVERSLLQLYKAPGFQQGTFKGVLQGIPIDATFVIPRNNDRAIVARDLAKLVRDGSQMRGALEAFVAPDQAQQALRDSLLASCQHANEACGARQVLAGGFSSQAPLFRDFQFMGLNTRFGGQTEYADGFRFAGLVFDGVVLGGVRGNDCTDYFILAGDPTYLCSGSPPPAEGKTFIINCEDDVQYQARFPFFGPNGPQFLGGFGVRGSEGTNDDRNYRTYEIAGASHLSTVIFDPIAAGLVSYPNETYPSWVDKRPVYRAMLQNLRLWVQHDLPPPPNALLELGQQQTVELEPAFPFPPPPDPPEAFFGGPQPYWVYPALMPSAFDRARQYDLMIEGGIRLTHVRTTVSLGPVHLSFGGPLGIARGLRCRNFTPLTKVFSCPAFSENQGLFFPPGFLFGDFIPYRDPNPANPQLQTELDAFGLPNPCALYYPTRGHYVAAVRLAADYAALKRWIPFEEVNGVVAAAMQKAQQFPGCVPK